MTLKLKDIEEAVAVGMRASLDGMRSRSRKQELARAREVFWLLAREMTKHHLSSIARYSNRRCHTTVMSGIRAIKKRLEEKPLFAEEVESIRSRLLNSDMREAA